MTKKAPKPTDAGQVAQYMADLQHPLKAEMEAVREIIKSAGPGIQERIKWNAPSYHYFHDIVTLGPPARALDKILLVFHHPYIVQISSPLLEGDFKDRRLAYFKNLAEIKANESELVRIIHLHLQEIDRSRSGS